MQSDRRWQMLGDRAVRFARPNASARAIVHAVRGWPGVVDVVVAGEDVAAYFIDPAAAQTDLEVRIAGLANVPETGQPIREHVLRVRYDGEDLKEVARATKLSRATSSRS